MNRTVVGLIVISCIILGVGAGVMMYVMDSASRNNTSTMTETEKTESEPQAMGVIRGSLTYPSEVVPDDLIVYAVDTTTGETFSTNEHLSGSQFTYGVGFRLEVPVGTYYLYGETAQMSGKAYYNEFITCGASVECSDMSKIAVTVTADKETDGIIVGDWYNVE